MPASQTGTESRMLFFLRSRIKYERLTSAFMINDIASPAIITVDSRSPLGINEKYFVSHASMRQMLQIKATLDQKDNLYMLQVTSCRPAPLELAEAGLQVTRYRLLDTRYWILDTRYWLCPPSAGAQGLAKAGCWILVIHH